MFLNLFSRDSCFPHGPAGPCSQPASLHPGQGPCSATGVRWEKQESVGAMYMLACQYTWTYLLQHRKICFSRIASEGHMIWSQPSQDQQGTVALCSWGAVPKAHSPAWLLQLELPATRRLSVDSGYCPSHIVFAFSLSSVFGSSLQQLVTAAYMCTKQLVRNVWSRLFFSPPP